METRVELILKFMLAVAAAKDPVGNAEVHAEEVLRYAEELVNAYYTRIV